MGTIFSSHQASDLNQINKHMQIIIRMGAREKFYLEIESVNKIKEVKRRINDKKGFTASQQYLFSGDSELKDEHILFDYNIGHGNVLDLILKSGMMGGNTDIFIVAYGLGRKRFITLHVNLYNTILEVKFKIQLKEFVPIADQSLHHTYNLCNERTLSDYGITRDSVLKLFTGKICGGGGPYDLVSDCAACQQTHCEILSFDNKLWYSSFIQCATERTYWFMIVVHDIIITS